MANAVLVGAGAAKAAETIVNTIARTRKALERISPIEKSIEE
jgi:hypothetical protein